MGPFLSYSVEVLDDVHHGTHRVAAFSRFPAAIRACKLAIRDERVTVALVKDRDGMMLKDRDGMMVYCADSRREWPQNPETGLGGSAQTPVFPRLALGTGEPEPDQPADIRAYRRHSLILFLCYLAAAWLDGSV
jgi:hypothetical protein